MENILEKRAWPEIVFSSSDSTISQAIHRALKAGALRKIAPRLYTPNFQDSVENIVKRNLYHILKHLFPGAVLSHRTALEGGLNVSSSIILTFTYTKKVVLPGITVRLIKGPGPLPGDIPFMGQLFLASRERALLENLQPSRERGGSAKTVSKEAIENFLDKLCRTYGSEELNRIRDRARKIALPLDMEKEFYLLDKLTGGLLGTKTAEILETNAGQARAKGLPYDVPRLELFANLVAYLNSLPIPSVVSTITTDAILNTFGFFEAYFSNYIEGTEFELSEARDIVLSGRVIASRPEDSHDILGTFRLVASFEEMRRVPGSAQELLALLQYRHHVLLSARQDKTPGHFKKISNRAGNTVFVKPELVQGTLIEAFSLYQALKPGIARAIFMMFMITEVHPFLDGNGRIARIMMNAELESAQELRIIVPTVFREDYLLALRRLSREGDPAPYVRMLERAQQFTSSIDFADYQKSVVQLTQANAFLEPSEGKLIIRQ